MPSFEDPILDRKPSNIFSGDSYDRILASFYKNDGDHSVQGRNSRVQVAIKSGPTYDSSFYNMIANTYDKVAGADLSSIFMPFETRVGSNTMPAFDPNASPSGAIAASGVPNLRDSLPVNWTPEETTKVTYRWATASGDSIPNLVSDSTFRGNLDAFRDTSNMRGIGMRLPMVAVGWGYTTDGRPWPSGNWADINRNGFKGPSGTTLPKGWMVDQSDYVAAPIDLRYDRRNNLWTAPRGFWAEIVDSGSKNNINVYSWKEKMVSTSGVLVSPPDGTSWTRKGDANFGPAYEVNNRGVPSGTNVWIQLNERTDSFQFEFGGSVDIPSGQYQYMVLQIVANNKAGYDFLRAHPLL